MDRSFLYPIDFTAQNVPFGWKNLSKVTMLAMMSLESGGRGAC
jgi:hypothetical protein